MSLLSADQILAATDLKFADLDLTGEWGGSVRIRVLSGRERNTLEREATGPDGKVAPLFREKLLVKCLCDEKGKPIFAAEQVAALAEKNAVTINKVFEACMRLNGFTKDTVEELAKN